MRNLLEIGLSVTNKGMTDRGSSDIANKKVLKRCQTNKQPFHKAIPLTTPTLKVDLTTAKQNNTANSSVNSEAHASKNHQSIMLSRGKNKLQSRRKSAKRQKLQRDGVRTDREHRKMKVSTSVRLLTVNLDAGGTKTPIG